MEKAKVHLSPMEKAKVPLTVALIVGLCFAALHFHMTSKCAARAAIQLKLLKSLAKQHGGELKKDSRGNDYFELKPNKGLKIKIMSILSSNSSLRSGDPVGLLLEARVRGPKNMPTLSIYRPGLITPKGKALSVPPNAERKEPLIIEGSEQVPDKIIACLSKEADLVRDVAYALESKYKRFFFFIRRKRLTMSLFYNFSLMSEKGLEARLDILNKSFIKLSKRLSNYKSY